LAFRGDLGSPLRGPLNSDKTTADPGADRGQIRFRRFRPGLGERRVRIRRLRLGARLDRSRYPDADSLPGAGRILPVRPEPDAWPRHGDPGRERRALPSLAGYPRCRFVPVPLGLFPRGADRRRAKKGGCLR